jgi:5-methylcytosine-specific restriction endonuclease McrBC regulatory subunit McrC
VRYVDNQTSCQLPSFSKHKSTMRKHISKSNTEVYLQENAIIFNEALNSMNDSYFTSNEFGKKLHTMGISKKMTSHNGIVGAFLTNNVIKLSPRCWKKRNANNQLELIELQSECVPSNDADKLISALKALGGYRILREKKQWDEI